MVKIKLASAALAALLLTACGSEDDSSISTEDTNQNVEETKVTEETPSTDVEAEETSTESSNEVLNGKIAEETEGNVEVVYTNDKPNYVHDMNGFKVSVDNYQIVKVTDMNDDYYIEFDDQIEGYVITATVTIDNTTAKAMYYTPTLQIRLSNESDYLPSGRTFVRDEYPKSKVETESSKWGAGEKITGLVTFTLTNDEFNSLSSVQPKFVIEGGVADNNQFSGSFREDAIFDFTFSEEQAAVSADAPKFYPDRLTTGNMADKVMIFEKTDINETQQLADVKVTLEGVQYTEVIPTEGNVERFRNFGDKGIVALTVKLNLDNQSNEPISIWNISSKVAVDEDRGNVLAQGMVEPSEPKEIQPGAQGEKYHVFLFRKDEFEIFKTFDLQFGPFVQEDGKDQFKGKTVTFSLPK